MKTVDITAPTKTDWHLEYLNERARANALQARIDRAAKHLAGLPDCQPRNRSWSLVEVRRITVRVKWALESLGGHNGR